MNEKRYCHVWSISVVSWPDCIHFEKVKDQNVEHLSRSHSIYTCAYQFVLLVCLLGFQRSTLQGRLVWNRLKSFWHRLVKRTSVSNIRGKDFIVKKKVRLVGIINAMVWSSCLNGVYKSTPPVPQHFFPQNRSFFRLSRTDAHTHSFGMLTTNIFYLLLTHLYFL